MPQMTIDTGARMEQGGINPAYTGFIQDIYPSDLGLNYQKVAPARKFKSRGDGTGYTRQRNMMDHFSVVDERLMTRRPGVPAEKIDRTTQMSMFSVGRRHLDGISIDDQNKLMRALHPDANEPTFDDARFVREAMMLAKEIRFAGFLKDDSNFGAVSNAAGSWADPNYDLRRELLAGKLAVKRQSGFQANVMALSYDMAISMSLNESIWKLNSALKDRNLGEDDVAALLARAFKIDKVIILSAQYSPQGLNANNEVNLKEIYSNDIVFYYEPKGGPDYNERCWALEAVDTFFNGDLEAGVASTWYDNDREATIIRCKDDSDFVTMDRRYAFKIKNAAPAGSLLGG